MSQIGIMLLLLLARPNLEPVPHLEACSREGLEAFVNKKLKIGGIATFAAYNHSTYYSFLRSVSIVEDLDTEQSTILKRLYALAGTLREEKPFRIRLFVNSMIFRSVSFAGSIYNYADDRLEIVFDVDLLVRNEPSDSILLAILAHEFGHGTLEPMEKAYLFDNCSNKQTDSLIDEMEIAADEYAMQKLASLGKDPASVAEALVRIHNWTLVPYAANARRFIAMRKFLLRMPAKEGGPQTVR